MTLGEWLDRWLTDYKENTVRPGTLAGYRSCIENYIKPRLGGKQVSLVTSQDVQKLYSPMWIDGKKHSCNVYAHTREECEEKLKVLIEEMKAELAELKRQKAEGTLPLQEIAKGKKKDQKKARLACSDKKKAPPGIQQSAYLMVLFEKREITV